MNDDTITITLPGLSSGGEYYYDNQIDLSNSTIDLTGIFNSSTDTIFVDDIGTSNWIEEQQILQDYKEEKEIRERNAGVLAAWEQYKIMVELAKNPPEILDGNE
jgi:hypothetical protein